MGLTGFVSASVVIEKASFAEGHLTVALVALVNVAPFRNPVSVSRWFEGLARLLTDLVFAHLIIPQRESWSERSWVAPIGFSGLESVNVTASMLFSPYPLYLS